MHYYLCRIGQPGWPAGGEDLPQWTSIEFYPSPYVVLASPKRYDGLRREYLGDDALSPSPMVHRKMKHAFRMNLMSKSLGKMLLELLLNGSEDGRCWRSLQPAGNQYEVWLGNEIVATMPCLRGGMGSNCDANLPTFATTTTDFTAYTAAEYPLASPFTHDVLGFSFLPFEVVDVPAGAPVTFFLRASAASPAVVAGAIDTRGYACDQSISATIGEPSTASVQVRAAGHGVHLRSKRADVGLDGDFGYGYRFMVEDPTSGTFEARLTFLTEFTSVPGDGIYEHWVLARQVLGGDRLTAGAVLQMSATGSSILGTTTTAVQPAGISLTSTNTRTRWGHPGFVGGGRSGILWPDVDSIAYFTTVDTGGRLDSGDPEFLDP